jgi:hypothetical protein
MGKYNKRRSFELPERNSCVHKNETVTYISLLMSPAFIGIQIKYFYHSHSLKTCFNLK